MCVCVCVSNFKARGRYVTVLELEESCQAKLFSRRNKCAVAKQTGASSSFNFKR